MNRRIPNTRTLCFFAAALLVAGGCVSHPLDGSPIDRRVVESLQNRTETYRALYQPALAESDPALAGDFALDLDADAALVARLEAALDRRDASIRGAARP